MHPTVTITLEMEMNRFGVDHKMAIFEKMTSKSNSKGAKSHCGR